MRKVTGEESTVRGRPPARNRQNDKMAKCWMCIMSTAGGEETHEQMASPEECIGAGTTKKFCQYVQG